MTEIHLGYQLIAGEPVTIPLHHTMITGMTRLSGKTTTIEALLSRLPAGFRALVFRTKRGEVEFSGGHRVQAYYRPSINDLGNLDWQYVETLLEASMREKMKMERSFIINACKGAKTLRDVYDNFVKGRNKATRGFDESIYTNLAAYFEMVLPQLEEHPFAEELGLEPGLNVMELGHLSEEVQALVISSCLEEIHQHWESMIVVIPEAWKFLPQARGNPVKWAAQHVIREGGASNIWLWLDSQDVTTVTKDVLKSAGVWLMGRQQEINEVKRVLAQLPTRTKPKPEEVMTLPVGHFWVATASFCQEVFVQPAWSSPEDAIKVAQGLLTPPDIMKLYTIKLLSSTADEPPAENIIADSLHTAVDSFFEDTLRDSQRRIEELQQVITELEEERDHAVMGATESLELAGTGREQAQAAQAQTQDAMAKLAAAEQRLEPLTLLEAALKGFIAVHEGPQFTADVLDAARGQLQSVNLDELAEQVARRLQLRQTVPTMVPLEALKHQFQQEVVNRLVEEIDGYDEEQKKGLLWLVSVVGTEYTSFSKLQQAFGISSGGSGGRFNARFNLMVANGWILKNSNGIKAQVQKKVEQALEIYSPTAEQIEETVDHLVARFGAAYAVDNHGERE